MRRILAATLCFLALAAARADAVTWCHDYVYFSITGQDVNKISPAQLEAKLKQLGYKAYPFSNAATLPRAQKILKPGDVILIESAHSGVMKSDGISHFIQVYGASGTRYTPATLPPHKDEMIGGFFQGDTLLDMIDRLSIKREYKVTIWRKQ